MQDLVPYANASRVYFSNENAACVSLKTQMSNARSFVGGTFVWTLHDYYGEAGLWPHISSSFGSFDLAGFPKAPVWWYRSWWLAAIKADDPSRPPLPAARTHTFCRLVESWQPGRNVTAGGRRTLTVYTNAPFARVRVDGAPVTAAAAAQEIARRAAPPATAVHHAAVPVAPFSSAVFANVTFAEGRVTAECLSTGGDGATVLASHTRSSWGAAASVVLSLDAPSPATGTGRAVYLDGEDVALVRATVLDANGHPVHDSALNLTFAVVDGPARVVGVGNGDPSDHDPNHTPWRQCYHGLVRAVVKVTALATGTRASRALVAAVNPDAGKGPWSSTVFLGHGEGDAAPATSFTVTATATGLPTASLVVPLSVDPADSPLRVAAASVRSADIGE